MKNKSSKRRQKLKANAERTAEAIKRAEEDVEIIKESLKKDRIRLKKLKKENKPFQLFLFTVIYHVKVFLKKSSDDNVNALTGQSAFFIILSIIPLLMFVISLDVLLTGNTGETAAQNTVALTGTPAVIAQFVLDSFKQISSGTAVITAVTALWSAGKGLYIITDGVSRIYRLPRKHTWILRRVFAMGYTAVLLLMMLLVFALLLLNLTFESYISDHIEDLPMLTNILFGWRYVIITVIITIFLTLALKLYLFRKVDNKRYVKFRVLLPGMLFTAIAWMLLTWGVNIYSRYSTSSLYGSLGSVFIVMMWIYFMMLLLLYGVQLNFIYREEFYAFTPRKAIAAIGSKLKKKKAKTNAASK